MSHPVRIVEVGPRDGLQNEPLPVSTDTKLELIARLAAAGLRTIEATAFVSPKWVPQMADHFELMRRLPRNPGVAYPVLTPNLRGFEAALAAGATEVAVFASASETFSQRNINCSIDESLTRFKPIFDAARSAGVTVRGYLSCVIACPYEGAIAPACVAEIAERLFEMGSMELSLGDTIGVGTPGSVLPMLETVTRRIPVQQLAGHFHDTFGMAVANVMAAHDFGLRTFDSAISGLGGCPYAKGASGNLATEELVYLMHGIGAETGVNLDRLVETSQWISGELQRSPGSRVTRAMHAARAQNTTNAMNTTESSIGSGAPVSPGALSALSAPGASA